MEVNKQCNQLEQMQTLIKMMRGGGLPGSSKHAGSKKQKVKKKKKKNKL